MVKYYIYFWSFFSDANYGKGITGVTGDISFCQSVDVVRFNKNYYHWEKTKIEIDSVMDVSKNVYWGTYGKLWGAKVTGWYEVAEKYRASPPQGRSEPNQP